MLLKRQRSNVEQFCDLLMYARLHKNLALSTLLERVGINTNFAGQHRRALECFLLTEFKGRRKKWCMVLGLSEEGWRWLAQATSLLAALQQGVEKPKEGRAKQLYALP